MTDGQGERRGDAPPIPRQSRQGRPPTHGLYALKRSVAQLGTRLVDRRTTLGKQLAAWHDDLVRDLGGSPSTGQLAVVDLAVRTKLMLDSIDAWLLSQPTLVVRRRKPLLPAVRERQQLADALARYLTMLGLERREAPPLDLGTYLSQRTNGNPP